MGCIACGGLAMQHTDVPLCKVCAEDVRNGGDDAVGRILAIKHLIDEEKDYRGDSRYTALEQKIRTLEDYIESLKTEAWKQGITI